MRLYVPAVCTGCMYRLYVPAVPAAGVAKLVCTGNYSREQVPLTSYVLDWNHHQATTGHWCYQQATGIFTRNQTNHHLSYEGLVPRLQSTSRIPIVSCETLLEIIWNDGMVESRIRVATRMIEKARYLAVVAMMGGWLYKPLFNSILSSPKHQTPEQKNTHLERTNA